MADLRQLDSYLPSIEKYLLAEDRAAFIKALPAGSSETAIFELLTCNDYVQFAELCRRLNLPDVQGLWCIKAAVTIGSDASDSDKLRAIKTLRDTIKPSFDHERPTSNSASQPIFTETKLSSVLPDEEYSLEWFVKNTIDVRGYPLNELTPFGYAQLKPEMLLKSIVSRLDGGNWQQEVSNMELGSLDDATLLEVMKKIIQLIKTRTPAQPVQNFPQFSRIYSSQLTLNQLELLPRSFPELLSDAEYYKSLYNKKWKPELEELTALPDSSYNIDIIVKKRQLLVKIRKELQGFKTHLLNGFIEQLATQILQLDLLLEKPDRELFNEYLLRLRQPQPLMCNDFLQRVYQQGAQDASLDGFWLGVHNLPGCRMPNPGSFIESYLKLIFKETPEHKEAEPYYQFFQREYIDQIFYKVLLALGKKLDNLTTLFPKEFLDALAAEKELTILPSNKKHFSVNEQVVLKMKVKNIRNITAEVYQLSTEKHYLNCESEIDEAISLDFIKPLSKALKMVEVTSPFKEFLVDFSLKGLIENKPSVYVVDFVGEGLVSRAIIRRGSITALRKNTLAGVELRFYDENRSHIEELDVWCNNRRLHVKGKHIIPYGQTEEWLRLIAVKNGFAETIQVVVPAESYLFTVSYIYHQENFLVGTKAKVILQAKLTNNGNPVTLKALKESSISVLIVNHLNIESSFEVSAVEWDHRNEYVLEIPVQSYLLSVNITVKTKVEPYSGTPIELTSQEAINFKPITHQPATMEMFLKRESEGFRLQLLGKNGEPKPLVPLQVSLYPDFARTPYNKWLKTNEAGEVLLGKLSSIARIDITVNSGSSNNLRQIWTVNDFRRQVQYPSSLHVRLGEPFSLPLWEGFDYNTNFSLFRVEGDHRISNSKAQLQVKGSRLEGKFERAGRYQLKFEPIGQRIDIFVMEATKWESEGQLYDDKLKQVMTLPTNAHQLIGLNTPKLQKIEEGYSVSIEMNLPADIPIDSVRAHIISSAFFYNCDQVDCIRKTLPPSQKFERQSFANRESSYLNNKKLSDEACYVINRQKEQKYVGNNLEKPHLLLKRLEKRDTGFDKEQLQPEGDFAANKRQSISHLASGACKSRERMIAHDRMASPRSMIGTQFSTNNNFLKYASAITPNIHGKLITFQVPSHHQCFKVLLTSQFFAIERDFGLPLIDVPTKDLRHSGLEDADKTKGITMSRQIYKLQKGDALKVKRNSMWTAVSSFNISAFAASKNARLWDWVLDWPTYSSEKKQEVYAKQCCHELNIYLKFKDPPFFAEVVKPFIANKLEKSVVDYCLLEHPKASEFSTALALEKLNAMEKCLLVDYLVNSKQIEVAQSIASSMQLKEKPNIVSGDVYQRQFDSIVTSKALEETRRMPAPAAAFGFPQTVTTTTAFMGGFGGQMPMPAMVPMQPQMYMAMMAPPPAPGGAFRPPMSNSSSIRMNLQQQSQPLDLMDDDYENKADEYLSERAQYKPAFKPVEKTKEYVETTYSGMKNPSNSKTHVRDGRFWVDLAAYFVSHRKGEFLSYNFLYINSKQQFALALSFLPSAFTAQFSLEADGEYSTVTAQTAFFAFVKEVKSVEYTKRPGIIVSQRFYDPSDPVVIQQDGTQRQKNVSEFIKDKVYACQTAVINTSAAQLDLQILTDIPQGSLPVQSHEPTKIMSDVIGGYAIRTLDAKFYFPSAGTYTAYPSNVSRNSVVIAKADQPEAIVVRDLPTETKMDSFTDILRSGTEKDVLQFLRQKNIFDPKLFNVSQVLWMLKNRDNYREAIDIFRRRSFFSPEVWSYGLLHEDIPTVTEYIKKMPQIAEPQLFEYFPLSSTRAHKFMKDNKSTILNKEFKETYRQFLLAMLFNPQLLVSEKNQLAFVYYLLLQDRVQEAGKLFHRIQKVHERGIQSDRPGFPQLQYDYIACFLDVYTGYPNLAVAREISAKYKDYKVMSWNKLFGAVIELLNSHDNETYTEEPTKEHDIHIADRGDHLAISLPEQTVLEINFHAVNLEMLFSQSPFLQAKTFATVKPFKTVSVRSEKGGVEKVPRPSEHGDVYVQPVELAATRQAQKLDSFLWSNPNVKAKVVEDEGLVFVYVSGSATPAAYCKVYVRDANSQETRFLRDGYTDIQGKFRYINAAGDADGVESFALLVLTEAGGTVKYARKPNDIASLG